MENAESYQHRVGEWMLACFGQKISDDKTERSHRFAEESLELVQSLGCTKEEVLKLVDYVFNRPVGEPSQEVGGVLVTLAALCRASKIDMDLSGETELNRVWKNIDKIREKQANKPQFSPLPEHTAYPDRAPFQISETTTARGFTLGKFVDLYGSECSIQKSSLATEDAIWLGVVDANPQVLHNDAKRLGIETTADSGWVDYPIPKEVSMTTRMHLSRDHVAALLPTLQRFVETGEI